MFVSGQQANVKDRHTMPTAHNATHTQVTFGLKPQLSALAALDAASAASSGRAAINSPAVLTCGQPAGSHPAGASQSGALCPTGPLVDVRIAAWIRDPSRSDVRTILTSCPDIDAGLDIGPCYK